MLSSYESEAARLAVDLINTYEAFAEEDGLVTRTDLATFADEHGFAHRPLPSRVELERVREARPLLRETFSAEDESAAVALLNRLLSLERPVPQLVRAADSSWQFEYSNPDGDLSNRLITTAAVGLLSELREHGMERMHACGASDCLDVFIDTTRNHSRRFCSPEVCGNRESQRAFRARQAG